MVVKRGWLLAVAGVALSGCVPIKPAQHRVFENQDVLVLLEPGFGHTATVHVIVAHPEARGQLFPRSDLSRAYDCKAGRSRTTGVFGFTPQGKGTRIYAEPGHEAEVQQWRAPVGTQVVEQRIVCDRAFAATRRVDGDLDEIEAAYRRKVG
jgi:hypothetical protein